MRSIIILLLFTTLACYKKPDRKLNTDQAQRKAEKSMEKDTTRFFKDMHPGTLEGIDELQANQLSYPYIACTYRDSAMEITSHFNEQQTRTWMLQKGDGFWYAPLTRPESSSNPFITLIFYRGTLVTLHSSKQFNRGTTEINPELVTYEVYTGATLRQTVEYKFNSGNRYIPLTDILNHNEPLLNSIFIVYREEEEQVRQNKLVLVNEKQYELRNGIKEPEQRKPITREEPFPFHSFFYYLLHRETQYMQNLL